MLNRLVAVATDKTYTYKIFVHCGTVKVFVPTFLGCVGYKRFVDYISTHRDQTMLTCIIVTAKNDVHEVIYRHGVFPTVYRMERVCYPKLQQNTLIIIILN